MSPSLPPGLLPEGLRDRLPPQATAQARIIRALLDSFDARGYDRVAPPLAEFEESLARQLKATRRQDLLRIVDPISQRTLALRPDITAQIGRIAATRLAGAPRPLRLCYAGPVIKLRATQLRPEREETQAGVELIGSDCVAASREVLELAVDALAAAGARRITVDLTLPDLVERLSETSLPVPPDRRDRLRELLDAKDAGALAAEGFGDWLPLIACTGNVGGALQALSGWSAAAPLADGIAALRTLADGLPARVTLDPAERHGFAYQSWFGFALYVEGVAGEVGRGGSYTILHPDAREEPAIGFSIYPDPLIGSVESVARPMLFLPPGHDPAVARRLRGEGWRTRTAFANDTDPRAIACSHRLNGEHIEEL